MAKLSKLIDIQSENTIDVNKFGIKNMFAENKGSMDRAELVSMDNICGRYMNEYIIDPEKTKALVSSIEKNGLLQPIVLLRMSDWLPYCSSEDEKQYLSERISQGFTYFIVVGHRRFRAMASLLSGKLIESNADLEDFYLTVKKPESELFKKFEVKLGKKEHDKYTQILAIIANPDEVKEQDIYNDSNITSRSPSQFEIVTSVYNQLLRSNKLEEVKNKFIASNKETVAVAIMRYIKEVYAIDVDRSRTSKYLKMSETVHPSIIQMIYDAKVTISDIESILPVYEKIKADGAEELLISQIENGQFIVSEWKGKYSKKKENTSSGKVNKKDVIKMLKKVKNGSMTIDEILDILDKK